MSGNYEKGIQHGQRAHVDLINDDISIILIDTTLYTVDLDAHEKLGDIPEAAIIAERLLTGKSLDGTAFRANDPVFTAVTGEDIGAYVIFKDTGDLNTSWLLYYDDSAPEYPLPPDGTDITVNFDTGVNGIFKE